MSPNTQLPISVLFDGEPAADPPPAEPDCFHDLHLDEIRDWVFAGREEYELAPLFHQPLRTVEAIRYRQEVLRDLERADVQSVVRKFAQRMKLMRSHLALVEKLHYARQQQRWLLEAVSVYCWAVSELSSALADADPRSEGFRQLRGYLAEYCLSSAFRGLTQETSRLEKALAGITYMVHVSGPRVRVLPNEEQADVSDEVEKAFAKFAQGSAKNYLVKAQEPADMNHVEARILDGVATQNPATFEALARFCGQHAEFADPTIARFDREVQFYLAYIDAITPLRDAGHPFTDAAVSANSKDIHATETYDLALARILASKGDEVVRNSFELAGHERVIVVSGPNNGGKTTFARTFGQLHYLASLGLPVPAGTARLFVPDRVFTLFEREEDITTLRGKFEDELVRMHAILGSATADSVLVINEAFGSTALHDAIAVGSRVMAQIIDRDALCVFVTFVDELASLGHTVVSMMSTVLPEDPSIRTLQIVRKPPDGRAFAAAIAAKYGLEHDRLVSRISG